MNALFSRLVSSFTLGVLVLLAHPAFTASAGVLLPGQRTDGSVLLPNQWSLRPVGRQVPLGDFPVNIAVPPDGKYAAVLHSGHGTHEIVVVDLTTEKVVARQVVRESYYGLEFSPNGRQIYCSGSSDEVVHVFNFADGRITTNCDIRLCDLHERGIPCGMAVSPGGRDLYVANVWGQCVSKVDLRARKLAWEIAPLPHQEHYIHRKKDTQTEKDDPEDDDLLAISKRADSLLDPALPDAPFPYGCRVDEPRQLLYVSLWARAAVAVINLRSNQVIALWPTQEHPNEMVLSKSGKHLFVANANNNTVTVFDTRKGKALETLYASFAPNALPGSMPDSLALSPDEQTLFVANACNNDVAVFDVSIIGKSRSLGFIPVGWFPTSVRVTPDGKHLLVANGKGLISKPNPRGPIPGVKTTKDTQVISDLFPGRLGIIDLPASKEEFRRQLAAYTAQARLGVPQETVPQVTPPANSPVPAQLGQPSPIKYVIYVVKENRTYDQVLGDMKEGNGDASLCLFPERVTPNLHKMARDYVLLDNFYVDAEVSADGHEWSMGAIATDFVEKTWPLEYRHAKKFPYPAEGHVPIGRPASGYIWDRAAEAGVSYFSFGEFIYNGKTTNIPCFTYTAALRGHFDPWFRSFDTKYPDVLRGARFVEEYQRFLAAGTMPHLLIVRMPNDHTSGAAPGRPTPSAQVSDNDQGVGMMLETVSHSKLWPETAMFIVEDDAQNGPDHVDAHRSTAYVVSPYTHHRGTDSTMYSTSSLLRTMELILGLQPMTQYDLAATPMYNAFVAHPDAQPYALLPSNVDLHEQNPRLGMDSKVSSHMDLSKEDAVDDRLLNEVIWRSVRGTNSVMPAPTRAAFVWSNNKPQDDDD